MSMFDYIKEQKANRSYIQDISEAQLIFEKQKQSIKDIGSTQGLKTIIEHWEATKQINENMFAETGSKEAFALYQQSKQFLNFIGNLLLPEEKLD